MRSEARATANGDRERAREFGPTDEAAVEVRRAGRRNGKKAKGSVLVALVMALVLGIVGVAYADAGDLDPTFSFDGKVVTDFAGNVDGAQDVAIQQLDGKVVAVGNSGGDFGLARYNPDGTLDASFDGDGKVTTDFSGNDDAARGVAIQSDGKIVAAGLTEVGTDSFDFGLARYNPDGSLDATFGTGGKVTTDFSGNSDVAFGVAIQSDGKVVAAGSSGGDFGLARYNPDGSLDATFDAGGKVTTDFGGNGDAAFDVAIQSDGKIVAAGQAATDTSRYFGLARYNPEDGSLDTSFDGDGKVTTSFGADETDSARSVAIQSDGKIVAAGRSFNGNSDDFALARYNTNGSLDSDFDSDGKVTTSVSGSSDQANSVAIQSDGKIVAAGQDSLGSSSDFALVRYNPDGSLDGGFGAGGQVTTSFTSEGGDSADGVAIQPDGKIVAAGFSDNNFALARYEASDAPPPQCSDDIDNDADGQTDFPGDAGCSSAADNTENSNPQPPAPQCSDSVDNDADGQTDSADADCSSAADNSESPDPPPGCTVVGTNGDDTLSGTSGPDTICGLGGDDTINADSGDDTVRGGDGDDTISGDSGNDTLNGESGNDTARGGAGGDSLSGGEGSDSLSGEAGNDALNTRDGVRGNDRADGGTGRDACFKDKKDKTANCER